MGRPARITREQAQEALRLHRTAYRAAEALGVSESSIKHHLGKTKGRRRRDAPPAPAASARPESSPAFQAVEIPEMQLRLPSEQQRNAYAKRAAILQQLAEGATRAGIAAHYGVDEQFIAWLHNRARA